MTRLVLVIAAILLLSPAGCKVKKSADPVPDAAAPEEAEEASAPSAPEVKEEEKAEALPSTIDEAVDFILSEMSDEDKKTFRETPRNDLIKYHHGFGTAVRNKLGLWSGNSKLMQATNKQHPDDASMVIIEALWDRLNEK
jgi:hypothetical protein